jgi:opacity protein-like surface antigen
MPKAGCLREMCAVPKLAHRANQIGRAIMKSSAMMIVRLASVLAAGMLAPVAAVAQTSTSSDTWQFEITPYGWLIGLKGTNQIGQFPPTSVDLSASDVIDRLDFAAFGLLEARRGRWGLLFDGMYAKLSGAAKATGPLGFTVVDAELEVRQTMLLFAGAYRVVEGSTSLDLVAGARYNKLDLNTNINASSFGPLNITRNPSGERDWWDPVIGVRVAHALNEQWGVVGSADVGGFGVGSELTWQALAGVSYAFTKSVTGKLGYRHMSIDYDKDSFRYDMDQRGFYVGVGIRF